MLDINVEEYRNDYTCQCHPGVNNGSHLDLWYHIYNNKNVKGYIVYIEVLYPSILFCLFRKIKCSLTIHFYDYICFSTQLQIEDIIFVIT